MSGKKSSTTHQGYARKYHIGTCRWRSHRTRRKSSVYESNYRSGLRVLELRDPAAGALREVGFFDIYPADDAPEFNGSWSVYPFFPSGTVVVNGIEQGLFVVRPRRAPVETARGLSVTLVPTNRPATVGGKLVHVANITNNGPDGVSGIQLTIQLSASATVLSTRSSRGGCATTGLVTCDIGALPPGAGAVVTVTSVPSRSGDLVATAKVVSDAAREVESSTMTVNTSVEPVRRELVLRQPAGGETFRSGRAATIQWVLRGVTGGIRIELSLDDGRSWSVLSDDAPNIGFYDWVTGGVATARARIRVTSVADRLLSATSNAFTIR